MNNYINNSKTKNVVIATSLIEELRDYNSLLLREYLIEKSGRFMDDGNSIEDSDEKAAQMARDKFNVEYKLCIGILNGVKNG